MIKSSVLGHFERVDRKIYPYLQQVRWEEWWNDGTPKDYFLSLCRSIIGQQLSGKVANKITERFLALSEGQVMSPDLLLQLTDEQLRGIGMSWAKARYVKNIAEAFLEGTINQTVLGRASDEEVIEHLCLIKGVGRWTAEMFLMFTLKREDVFSHGDLGLKRGIEKVYGLANPKKEVIEQIIGLWTPYKTYGSIALWQSLEKQG